MTEIAYVAKARIERRKGPLRYAYLAGESNPVVFSVHGAIASQLRCSTMTRTMVDLTCCSSLGFRPDVSSIDASHGSCSNSR